MTFEQEPGLQTERTIMAWQRTALGLGGVSALTLRQAQGDPLLSVPGVAGLTGAVALLAFAEMRYLRSLQRRGPDREPMGPSLVQAVAAGTALLAVATVAVVLAVAAGGA